IPLPFREGRGEGLSVTQYTAYKSQTTVLAPAPSWTLNPFSPDRSLTEPLSTGEEFLRASARPAPPARRYGLLAGGLVPQVFRIAPPAGPRARPAKASRCASASRRQEPRP